MMDSATRTKLSAVDTVRVVVFAPTPGEEASGSSFELAIKGVADVIEALDAGRN